LPDPAGSRSFKGSSSGAPADAARLAAYQTLRAVSADDAYANLVLPGLLGEADLPARDSALATELAYGTLRAQGTLDEILRSCSSRELADIEPAVLDLLRLGAYQLLKTRIPAHAAVATTVDLTRSSGNGRSAGFVNAVLRKVSVRDFDSWCGRIGSGASALGQLAIRYSHPGWIVSAFEQSLAADGAGAGSAELEAALAADDTRPETHLVAWPGRVGRDELAAQASGVPGPYSPYAVRLVSGGEPGGLVAVQQHQAGVQDEGSQLCAIALAELPLTGADRNWLDLCAGPGGKAALLAALATDRGATLTANELHPHRADLIARATQGWNVEITVGDARDLAEQRPESFDRVLLDAPCTGLGALRRRPEARWRKSPDDLAQLVRLQADLLSAAIALVRPGGVVGYVTCSPHLAETRAQIDAVLAGRDDIELVDARPVFEGVEQLGDTGTVQLWPHRHGTDAMFFAGLVKRAGQDT
jgi:16S rRNA (cytosine967-C5)-methyltransferase